MIFRLNHRIILFELVFKTRFFEACGRFVILHTKKYNSLLKHLYYSKKPINMWKKVLYLKLLAIEKVKSWDELTR